MESDLAAEREVKEGVSEEFREERGRYPVSTVA